MFEPGDIIIFASSFGERKDRPHGCYTYIPLWGDGLNIVVVGEFKEFELGLIVSIQLDQRDLFVMTSAGDFGVISKSHHKLLKKAL